MVNLRPFRALHYDPAVVGDLAAVIAPPYDVIDAAELDRLYDRSPYNVVRIDLNRSADRYAASAAEFRAWLASGVLVRDAEPCLYYYVQDFVLPEGDARQRSGLMAAVRLEPFENGNIRPHERTFSRAKEDRLKLTIACRANLSSIFGIYPGHAEALAPAREISEGAPAWIDVRDERGGRHRVWRVPDPSRIEGIRASLRDATILIADGHHRYETALAYRERRRAEGDTDPDAPHNDVLMYLTSMEDPGLLVLPTHRLWRPTKGDARPDWFSRLAESFDIEEFEASPAGEAALLEQLERERGVACFGLRGAEPERCCILRFRDGSRLDGLMPDLHPVVRRLDVAVLDALVLRRMLGVGAAEGTIAYTHDQREALAAPRRGEATAAFLMRPPRMSEVEAVCMAGQLMPEKSTYFYPKLQTGLVFHSLDRDE
jgi:uncharacterized protein (DUF1015 family)